MVTRRSRRRKDEERNSSNKSDSPEAEHFRKRDGKRSILIERGSGSVISLGKKRRQKNRKARERDGESILSIEGGAGSARSISPGRNRSRSARSISPGRNRSRSAGRNRRQENRKARERDEESIISTERGPGSSRSISPDRNTRQNNGNAISIERGPGSARSISPDKNRRENNEKARDRDEESITSIERGTGSARSISPSKNRRHENGKARERNDESITSIERGPGSARSISPSKNRRHENGAAGSVSAEEPEESDNLDKMERGGITLATDHPPSPSEFEKMLKGKEDQFENDFEKIGTKIRRFPAGLQGLGSRYITPMALAIGPYHRPGYRLKEDESSYLHEMEKVKQVAASHFIRASHHSFEKMRAAVLSVAGDARSFYDIDDSRLADFVDMLVVDGCFLLQYMLTCTAPDELPPSLLHCFEANEAYISNDIMLLENQLPWIVVETLRQFRPSVNVEEFIAKMGRTLQVCGDKGREPFVIHADYNPPHLLALLWLYKAGSINVESQSEEVLRPMSKTISVIELAEIGIKLTTSNTAKFVDMGIKRRPLYYKIFLAPLLLDEVRSRWLVNMAAFEVCMATSIKNPIICSYLAVLAMLMDREDDVHKLRSKRLVQGELTNKETLDFFKSLIKHISGGPLYIHILEEIESYKIKWWIWIKIHKFVYKNFKTIAAVLSTVSVLVAIFKVLLSIKKH